MVSKSNMMSICAVSRALWWRIQASNLATAPGGKSMRRSSSFGVSRKCSAVTWNFWVLANWM